MARKGLAFFDSRGQYFKTPEEATVSDLAALLGKIGDGESLAPGIAFMLLEKREDIERIFAEHDKLQASGGTEVEEGLDAENVTQLSPGKKSDGLS